MLLLNFSVRKKEWIFSLHRDTQTFYQSGSYPSPQGSGFLHQAGPIDQAALLKTYPLEHKTISKSTLQKILLHYQDRAIIGVCNDVHVDSLGHVFLVNACWKIVDFLTVLSFRTCCSQVKTCWLKKYWICSLAMLMHSCSKELRPPEVVWFSKPKMSSNPTDNGSPLQSNRSTRALNKIWKGVKLLYKE